MIRTIITLLMLTAFTLQAEVNVLAFSGSTRNDSLNQKLVTEAALVTKQLGANVTLVNLKDYEMPLYNSDLEAKDGQPIKAQELREKMKKSQVIMIASPEYNGSLSGTLKNTIDWLSRDENGQPSRDAYLGKKFVIMSTSPGPSGGVKGLAHLRSIIENIGGTVLTGQLIVPNGYEAFDGDGHLKNEEQSQEMQNLIKSAL